MYTVYDGLNSIFDKKEVQSALNPFHEFSRLSDFSLLKLSIAVSIAVLETEGSFSDEILVMSQLGVFLLK